MVMSKPVVTGPKAPPLRWVPTRAKAASIVLWYAGLSGLWVIGSGLVLHHFVHDFALAELLEDIKGWFFVLVTALLLGWGLNRYFRDIRNSAQQLQDNEAKLRLVGDNLPDSYVFQYVPGPDGKPLFTYVSAGVERMHGVKPADVLRDSDCLRGLVVPELRPALAAAEAASAKDLSDFDMEVGTRGADGQLRLIHLRSHPNREADGSIHWDGIAVDITERKRAEESLQRTEQNYREIFNATNEAIFLHDAATGRVLDVNDAMLRMHGYDTKAEFLSNHVESILANGPPYHREEAQRRIRLAIEQGPQVFEWLNRKRNGDQFWVEVSLRSSQIGGQGRVLAVVRDITERKRTEKILLDNEEKFRQLADNISDVFWMASPDLKTILYVSPGYERIWGRSVESLYAHPHQWVEAILPEERERVFAAFAALAGNQPEVNTEYRIARPDGSVRWIQDRGFQVRNGAGELIRLAGIASDVTERKKSEAALRENEEQFRAMFEVASIGMAQADPHTGRWLRVNQKMCEITGYSATEMLQLCVPEITHPEDRASDWEAFQRVVRGEAPDYRMEKRYLRKDGKVAWVNVNVTIIRDAAGRPTRTMAAIENITARKQAEEERMRLVTAMEQSAESIMITDTHGTLLYVNPAFENISGYSRQEVIGKNPRLLKSGKQDAVLYQHMWETLTHGETWRGRFVNRRKDGSFYEEDATITPVRDAAGNVVNYVAIKLDVTREVELENQLRQAQKMEAIGQLAGGVAHDFNNILGAMMMQTELTAMTENMPAEAEEGLREIRASAERAANLTRQLLLFSRRQVMQARDLDLNEVVTSLAKMLRRIIGEDVRLQLHLHSAPLMTHADAGMLDQLLMNLAVNARDAMSSGGRLVIETSAKTVDEFIARSHPDATPGQYVCLSISDNGCGIPPEVMPRIFEPFFTTKAPGKGTGLGLATVFGIVKQHHGWIKVDSNPGWGTNFQIFIPACPNESAAASLAKVRRTPRGGTETILLAEDDPGVRLLTRAMLERHGYRVLEAASGLEAIRLWPERRGDVALLLTDLVMPGGTSGQQLARRLQEDNPRLKVIYMSGYSAEIAGRELVLRHGENFVQKPFPPDHLLETIRSCLDG